MSTALDLLLRTRLGAFPLAGPVTQSLLLASSFLFVAPPSAEPVPVTARSGVASARAQAQIDDDWWHRAQGEVVAAEYHFSGQEAGAFAAPNRAQGLRARIDAAGVYVVPRVSEQATDWSLRIETKAIGRGARLDPLAPGTPVAQGESITMQRGALLEWYRNDARGIEQGWTVPSPPVGDPGSELAPLRISLGIDGLSPVLAADGRSARFVDDAGSMRLRYHGLRAWDAGGRELDVRLVAAQEGLGVEVIDRDASYPITIDPILAAPVWTFESGQIGAGLGFSVATAGDVNGDGFSDVIVGASGYDAGEADEGRAFVFHGTASGPSTVPDWTAESNQEFAAFASCVATAGDVNGDGYDEVIVSAPLFDGTEIDEGLVRLYMGSATGLVVAATWTLEGGQAMARLGASIAPAGDVDGDGLADVIVGSPFFDGGQPGEGLALVFLGAAGAITGTADWSVQANVVGAEMGASVAAAGDVNGDGFGDVIVGSPGFTGGMLGEGRAQIFLGSAAGPSMIPTWTVEGNQVGARFGASVSSAGDVNGNGYSEVVVGAPFWDGGNTDEGRAVLFTGSGTISTTPFWTTEGNQDDAQYGTCVATAGDVDADGYSEVIVGAPLYDDAFADEGKAYMYEGSPGGLSSTPRWTTTGGAAGALLGICVGPAGDVDGDGFGDLIVGASGHDGGEAGEGQALVFFGSALGVTNAAAWNVLGEQAGSSFGSSVDFAGDVNGDGFGDVVVGASQYDSDPGADITSDGKAYLFFGTAGGLATTPAWTFVGGQKDAKLGESVAGAGDVNGDGYADVIVGAFGYDSDPGAGLTSDGRAWVFLGSAAGLSATPVWVTDGGQTNARYAFSVSSAGDVNGDGFSDVIVGARFFDSDPNPGDVGDGRAFLYLGSATGPSPTPDWVVDGVQEESRFGITVASAGDVNGDGYSDVAVSAILHDSTTVVDAGRVYVYHGSQNGLQTTADWILEGTQVRSWLGLAVGSGGDVNGDGFGDLVVAAPFWDFPPAEGGIGAGAGFVYLGSASGLAADHDWILSSGQVSAGLGRIAGLGDVDGDGYDDVIVGIQTYNAVQMDEGRIQVFRGSADGLSETPSLQIDGSELLGAYGAQVTGGDLNGDGFADAIVSALRLDGPLGNEGAAFAYLGNGGGGASFRPQQFRSDDSAPIDFEGLSDSQTSFRIHAEANGPAGFAATPGGRRRVMLEWEVKEQGTPLDGSGLERSAGTLDTGAPGSGLALNELVTGLTVETAYHWRARVATIDPYFPHGPWFSISAHHFTQTHLRTYFLDTDNDGVSDSKDLCPGFDDNLDADLDGAPDGCDLCPGFDDNEDMDSDGTPDGCDGCPGDPAKTAPGICGCGEADVDSDNDGTLDCFDDCPQDPNKTSPGTCGCGTPDTTDDTDNDGVIDCIDQCPGFDDLLDTDMDGAPDCIEECDNDPNKTDPGECGCGVPETDSDGDGTPDCNDNCPFDFFKTEPGICGCGIPDTDSDNDGVVNCEDGCPLDPTKTAPGDCGCGTPDTDSDGDGVANCIDACPGFDDFLDTDNDGTVDCMEGCPNDPNKLEPGECGCGNPDVDTDGDTILDCNDQCPGQDDLEDPDNDGVLGCLDGCPNDPNKSDPGACGCGNPDDDTDGDGAADCIDICPGFDDFLDTDGDGTVDCMDGCPNDMDKTDPGICGCGMPDVDSDGDTVLDCDDLCPGLDDLADSDDDGTVDCMDGCPHDPDKTDPGVCGCEVSDVDTDGDSVPDCVDQCPGQDDLLDSDGDGTANCLDGCPNDPNKTAPGVCGCGTSDEDTDGDSVPDCLDICPGFDDMADLDQDGTPDGCDGCPDDDQKTDPGQCGCGNPDTDSNMDNLADCLDCNDNGVHDDDDISFGTSEDCNDNSLPDECDIAAGSSTDDNSDGIPDECVGFAITYCQTAPNSASAVGGLITFAGSVNLSDNNMALKANQVPNSIGIFFFGTNQVNIPFGNGFRCAAGLTFRKSPVMAVNNVATQLLNFQNPELTESVIEPNDVWNFQYWYRDPSFGGPATFNLTNGLQVFFGP